MVAVLALASCSMPATMNPVDWWHGLEGGPIAETRPPPPNADDPYGNLASVPTKPKAEAAALRGGVATRLLADRASAKYAEATVPLTTPPAAATQKPPAAPAPTGQSDAVGGTLQAATAPPPAAPTAAATSPPAVPGAVATTTGDAPIPQIPATPPAPPVIAGVGIPEITRPSPPPPAPVVRPPSTAATVGTAVTVPFAAGSAELAAPALTALRQLAIRRGSAVIAVTGYGDAASSDPPAQSSAMPLAWARAQSIAGALRAAGVPMTMLRMTAEATGFGGVAVVSD